MKEYRLAVIGRNVSQSLSPLIQQFIARNLGIKVTYDNLSLCESGFECAIETVMKHYDGFNLTYPYKLTIIPYLDELKDDALAFGSVNTVLSGKRWGYNTDGLGFKALLELNGVETSGKKALVLGAGGAGRSVCKTLLDGGAEVDLFNRTPEKAVAVANEFPQINALKKLERKQYSVIVNATGVGAYDTDGVSPVGEEVLSLCETAVDLLYYPRVSEFLKIAGRLGKKTVNGLTMLFCQAYFGACIFYGLQPDRKSCEQLYYKFLAECNQ